MLTTGKVGTLRILDGSEIIAKGAQATMSCFTYVSIGTTFADKTAEAYADDTDYTGNFWAAASDTIYVGQTSKFGRIKFLKDGGVFAIAAGLLIPKYYNGTSWVTITDFNDGTAVGGHTFAADGYIDFKIPQDWAVQGDASLDADMYYIELNPTALPSTEPSADVLAPVDGKFFDVKFASMDFSGPLGRPKTAERLKLNRGNMDSCAHFVEGPDDPIYEAVPISFSLALDDTCNREYILLALECGTVGSTYWTGAGVTTKGDTKNDGTNANPAFVDSGKKCVDIVMIWANSTGSVYGRAYYEVYFPPNEQSISEAEDAVTLTCAGGCYGVIEGTGGLASRY